MAPNKGAKRKSESPQREENVTERKRYSTRSSNRNRVSYNNESEDDDVKEPPAKIVCSSEDDDFMIDDEAKDKKEIIKSSPTLSETDKRKSRFSVNHRDSSKQKNAKVLPQVPINVGFKPVSYNVSKMKSELDLSDDSSDSENSMKAKDFCFTTIASEKECDKDFPESACMKQNQEKLHCTPSKKVLVEELNIDSPTGINPWMQNLKALKNEVHQENECQMKTEIISTKAKGKKIKPPATKKINKDPAKNSPLNEISVAEMLKQEKIQESSSEDDDENWEKVKPSCDVPEQARKLPKSVEITLEVSGLKTKKKGLDVENLIRLKINRIRREIQLVLL
jgi:hypothetical protein